MKKLLFFCVPLLSLLAMAIACNQTKSPTTPPATTFNAMSLSQSPTATPTFPCNAPAPSPTVPFPVMGLPNQEFFNPPRCGSNGVSFFTGDGDQFPFDFVQANGAVTEGVHCAQNAVTANNALFIGYLNIPNDLVASNVVVVYSAEAASPPITVTTCLNGNSLPNHTQGTNNNFPGQFANAVTLVIPDSYFHSGLNVITFGVARSAINTGIGLCYDIFGCFIPAPSPSVTASPTPTNTPTPTFTSTPTPTCVGNGYNVPLVPYFQNESPWGDNFLDDSTKKIKNRGCFLTCMAMIAQVNPGELDIDLTNNGAIDENGDLDQYKAANFLGWPGANYKSGSNNNITQALKNGNYVIAHVPSSTDAGHYVVVTGSQFDPTTSRCRFTIEDPNSNSGKTFLDEYPSTLEIRIFGSNGNATPAK